jgi:hypothetical protein
MSEQIKKIVINPFIHKRAGLSPNEFLQRLNNVKALQFDNWPRLGGLPSLTYYPISSKEWTDLASFHRLINIGDFSCFDIYTTDYVFAVILPEKLYHWLANTELVTVQRQIINWLAACSYLNTDKKPGEIDADVFPALRKEINSVAAKFYIPHFPDAEFIWGGEGYLKKEKVFLKHYIEVSKSFSGGPPPEFFKLFRPGNPKSLDIVGKHSFTYEYAFMFDRHWKNIVEQDGNDDLLRAENSSELWENWRHTFSQYEQTRNHVFSLCAKDVPKGFIYIFRGNELCRYKIGFTADEDPYKRQSSLQTGSAEGLLPVGHFPAASQKTETVVKTFFGNKKVRPNGEWFVLTDQELANLLDEDWRIKNNIF